MINQNIQIMRGLSLLIVFLFHLQAPYFSYGYLGVDIFFIISGFLMPIILPKYTPSSYIKARIKRLYPALSFAVLISLLAGFFILMPGEYKSLSESSLASLAFSSNYYFLYNTGYFDVDSKLQFLLHTWTLGNEFLGYFLIFIAWLVFRKKNLLTSAYILCILSLSYIILKGSDLQYLDPIPRLYLFFLAFIVSTKYKESSINDTALYTISLISLSIIVYFFGDLIVNNEWPNKSIIILPAFVLPLMMMKSCILPSMLRPTFLKLGDWSYSIYLWHWLIISIEFVYLRNTDIASTKEALVLLVSGFTFGVLSYYFIERNIKLSYVTTALSLVFAVFIYSSNGIESRVNEDVIKYADVYKMSGVDYIDEVESKGLIISVVQQLEVRKGSTLVIGDSFSQHILPIMKEAPRFNNDNIYRLHAQPDILINNWEKVNDLIKEMDIDNVLISYRLNTKNNDDIKKLPNLFNKISTYDITVIRDIPSLEIDTVACYIKNHSRLAFQGCKFDIDKGIPREEVYNKDDPNWAYLKNNKTKYKTLDTHTKLCNELSCVTIINDEFIMRDKTHFNEKLSKETNKLIGELIF